MRKHIVGENGLTYTLGKYGCYYPDIFLEKGAYYPIGKYGRMRKEYLKERKYSIYMTLVLDGTLNQYLHKIDEDCNKRLYELIECMKLREGVTEQLKAENQMLWVGMMNNIKACAEEVVFAELLYC